MAGPGAVGGERSEPPSATDSRPRTVQPSLGWRGERANEPVTPSKPERRRHGRTQFHSIAASACSWIALTKSTRPSQGRDGTLTGAATLTGTFQSARPRAGARRAAGPWWRGVGRPPERKRGFVFLCKTAQSGIIHILSPKPQMNLQSAKEYFREHLCVGDYYAEGQTISGEWFGEAAEKLGLKGNVTEKEFLALCEGLNPTTGEWLTARKNSTRVEDGKIAPNRRVFYDFTFSPLKSVSVVALYQDVCIVELHDRAVRMAMLELEKFARTRVRRSGEFSDRETGNVIGASFQHDTSRELDPHLHTHCVVMNATFDPAENRWKALEASGMYRAQKFAENFYYHELAQGLRLLGYELENNARDFEIKGVPASVIERFSKRHRQIDEETKKRIEKEGLRGNVKALRKQVAHDERKRKIKYSTASRLRPSWAKQMTPSEQSALNALRELKLQRPQPADAAGIVAWADQHLFERRSVVQEHELVSTAFAHGRGQTFDLVAVKQAIGARN
jgi:conjugative relaxase-like TrwC/TraI family protein